VGAKIDAALDHLETLKLCNSEPDRIRGSGVTELQSFIALPVTLYICYLLSIKISHCFSDGQVLT